MHVLPRVRELHERFPDSLSVIGVHAGKFTTERRTERIASAADRLGVHHAIVNDRQFRIWRSFAVEAWPTIALIDAEGYLIGTLAREFDTESIAEVIARTIADAEAKRVLVRSPESYVKLQPPEGGLLRFPSRAIQSGDRLFVSDTGHGRVLEIVLDTSGLRGKIVREWSGFDEPQGLALDHADTPAAAESGPGPPVYVADRAGHSVWRLGPGATDRERIAGTGAIAQRSVATSGNGPTVELRSPWGLAAVDGRLLITMAGSHQLFALAPESGDLRLVAGSGAEAIRDGRGPQATLAQPTGLCAANGRAFVADCESSAIRSVSHDDEVRTIVGTGLFDFGDRDATGDDVRLQHCQDVAHANGVLAVVDTYNDRLKRVDPVTRTCAAWPGEAGEAGALREPGGVSAVFERDGSVRRDSLLVADTGNHRIVHVRPDGSLGAIEIEEM